MANDTANPFRKAAEDAARETDEELAAEEAKAKAVTWDELKKMLPSPVDQQNLDELMQIVNSATAHNQKVAALIQNIEKLGGVLIKVLSKIPGGLP
jgi:hypothetical protein